MKPTLIVVLGKTRSGKDTIGEVITSESYYRKRVKMADQMKRFIEKSYDLPIGAMEDPEYRNSKLPDSDRTYLDLMIEIYTLQPKTDPLFWKRETFRQMRQLLEVEKLSVVLTDLRQPSEVTEVLKLAEHYPLIALRVNRDGVPDIVSDESLEENWQRVKNIASYSDTYVNNGTLEQLRHWTIVTLRCYNQINI